MLSNRERNGFNADPLEPGYVKFRAPKSDNLSLTYGRPEPGLVAEARLQLTSGGEAIPTKTINSLSVLARGLMRTYKADASAKARTRVHCGPIKSD